MQRTEVRIHGSGCPASLMLAAGDAQIGCLIPAEELTFSWMNFGTDCGLKVFVTDLTVFIRIKFVEKFHEPFIFHFDAPMFHIVAELMWLNRASLFQIHVLEGFSQRFPLEFNLFEDFFFQVFIRDQVFSCLLLRLCILFQHGDLVPLILRVHL